MTPSRDDCEQRYLAVFASECTMYTTEFLYGASIWQEFYTLAIDTMFEYLGILL